MGRENSQGALGEYPVTGHEGAQQQQVDDKESSWVRGPD